MILGEDTDSINAEHEQTPVNMLQHDITEPYRKEEEFQWAQREFLTYITEATYMKKRETYWLYAQFSWQFFLPYSYVFVKLEKFM